MQIINGFDKYKKEKQNIKKLNLLIIYITHMKNKKRKLIDNGI